MLFLDEVDWFQNYVLWLNDKLFCFDEKYPTFLSAPLRHWEIKLNSFHSFLPWFLKAVFHSMRIVNTDPIIMSWCEHGYILIVSCYHMYALYFIEKKITQPLPNSIFVSHNNWAYKLNTFASIGWGKNFCSHFVCNTELATCQNDKS